VGKKAVSGPTVANRSSPATALAMPLVRTGSAPNRATGRVVIPCDRTATVRVQGRTALNGWFERFISYIGTKHALVAELSNYLDKDAPLFQVCRTSLRGG
jgi:hypothetical protein